MRFLAAIGLMLLASCVPDAPQAPEGRKLSDAERVQCLAAGGTVERGGLLPDEVCYRPQADAGKACTKQGDCAGQCLAETMTCSKVTPMFGCFGFMDEQGRRADICVD